MGSGTQSVVVTGVRVILVTENAQQKRVPRDVTLETTHTKERLRKPFTNLRNIY